MVSKSKLKRYVAALAREQVRSGRMNKNQAMHWSREEYDRLQIKYATELRSPRGSVKQR